MRKDAWFVALLVVGAGLSGLGAKERQESEPVRPAAPPPQSPARPGAAFSIELGNQEALPFVWIAPMKMWVGKYEVGNGQYRRYDAAHDSTNVLGRDMDSNSYPVVHVSWEDARNYCGWLNRHYGAWLPTGFVCRLPSVREWAAYAACGQPRVYPWGNQWPPPDYCNYRGMEGSGLLYSIFEKEKFIRGHNDGYVVSAPLVKSGVNAWGLYGVGGNVWEWCHDWADAEKMTRSIRGGAWNTEREQTLRIDHRAGAPPDSDNECIGFRVVIGPPIP